MEVIGEFVFFAQGPKLLSLQIESSKTTIHTHHTDEITCMTQSCGILYTGSLDGSIIK